ncbi:MAG: DUF4062 domain-containing protein [Treponema sp.]|jgi:hypothetical protein|nr:DUF4062 domain-containing protein [Treponema sp.]
MKHHIFIGSTLDDLKNERKELPRIVMELGHIPVMADYLDDTARNSLNLLQKVIEECDYFVALVANKYSAADGKILPLVTQCSIAAQKGIPVLALVIDEKARSTQAKREQDPALISKLDNFKARLREGSCETWLNTPDLRQKAQSLLVQELNINARPGWVRAEKLIDPTVANEISRLSGENDILRRRIKIDNGELVSRLRDQLKHALKVLALNKVTLSFYYASGDNWENSRQFRYIRIFKLLVPELAVGKSAAEISRFLGTVLNPNLDKTVRKDYPTPTNTIKKMMADFSMLKLVRCINDEAGTADEEIWEITEYGKELYAAYRMRQLEKALVKKPEN